MIPLIFEKQLEKILNFEFVKDYFGDIIILFLIFYCYRDFSLSGEYLLRVVIGFFVFFIQWSKENSLMSIFLGTGIYMVGRVWL
jgi:branched-subunit amino acid transport protein AzlD